MAKKHETLKEIEAAEKAVATAKAKHREAFRKAIAQTFEEFGLVLVATVHMGAPALAIDTLAGRSVELPE